ncbi:iron uptake transporter permease EfeU [Arthrobacter psychrochitiniphilus]|uniref:iron uptake transporter permease EfeU n=1 Tax=Arthrobacter psychrochitiniphilus TaxID=291045 RepID=UPI003F7BBBFD
MLATFVIGLREGLEAALIVGMIAAFLRRNGVSLRPMWLGVGAAVLLSALTGIVLELVSAALPQQQQEAMETLIGAAAVLIVTYMILWMSKNSRSMKSLLETHAWSALKGGSVTALALMAFLAVLREGVETAVFMVAAFQSSLSPLAAGLGAVLGLGIACGIGFLLFRGAIKLNLAKFFKATGIFLVFVAAGLVMKSLRTAHEAGWLNVGQGATIDLTWLAPNGSARAAILTGVFGIPPDPRVVELLGWALYLIPMLAFILWPRTWRPSPAALPRVYFASAGAMGIAALTLAITAPLAIPANPLATSTTAAITSSGDPAATLRVAQQRDASGATLGDLFASWSAPASLSLVETASNGIEISHELTGHGTESHAGRTVSVFTSKSAPGQRTAGLRAPGGTAGQRTAGESTEPATLTAKELATLNGGRMPVGISASANPGPFTASWKHQGQITLWMAQGVIVDAVNTQASTLTLTGGGLGSPRTIAVHNAQGWHVPDAQVSSTVAALNSYESAASENVLWARYLPALLGITALFLAVAGLRKLRAAGTSTARATKSETTPQRSAAAS